jgi:hypothetical protein
MEINAAGMKKFIPTERCIPAKRYVSVWVCVDVILSGRQGAKLALGKLVYLLGIKSFVTSLNDMFHLLSWTVCP